MLLKKLAEILKTFDKTEVKKFRRFISSAYFNTNESVIKLFRLISSMLQGDQFDMSKLVPEELFRKIYSGRKYDEKTFRYLLSTLYTLLEKYLAISLFEKSGTEMQKYVVDDLTERRLFRLAEKNLIAIESGLDNNMLLGGEYIYNKEDIALFWHQLYFLSNKQDPLIEKRLEQGELQMFSSVVELSHIYQILQQVSYSYNQPLKDNIVFEYLKNINYVKLIEYIEKNEDSGNETGVNNRLVKVLKIYFCFMITIMDNNDEIYFEKMNSYVEEYAHLFGKPELQNLHIMLTTCCLRKRKAINEEKYVRKFFEIIKRGVSLDLYTSYTAQYMDVINFLMIFQTSLQLGEKDWAAEFLRNYGERLSPEYAEDITGYAFAELFFHKKQFSGSLSSLSKVKLSLYRLKIPVKTLQLRLFYELNYIEEAYSMIDAFSHFLATNNKIREEEKRNYTGFLNYYRELLRVKAGTGKNKLNIKFMEELQKASLLPYKKWLLEKAEELNS